MYIIAGLGNHGNEYKNTRHNVGFMIIDGLIGNHGNGKSVHKFSGILTQGSINNLPVIFIKPQTYMNLSGICIGQVCNFYKIIPKDVIVIHDEIDIPFLQIKTKIGGGNAGHNGLKSIDSLIGKDYHRIRIGIDRPQIKEMVADYVLSNFSSDEIIKINELQLKIEEIISKIIKTIYVL